jgi:hypothetical protein
MPPLSPLLLCPLWSPARPLLVCLYDPWSFDRNSLAKSRLSIREAHLALAHDRQGSIGLRMAGASYGRPLFRLAAVYLPDPRAEERDALLLRFMIISGTCRASLYGLFCGRVGGLADGGEILRGEGFLGSEAREHEQGSAPSQSGRN